MAVGSQTGWCLMGKYMRKFATSDKFIKNFNLLDVFFAYRLRYFVLCIAHEI